MKNILKFSCFLLLFNFLMTSCEEDTNSPVIPPSNELASVSSSASVSEVKPMETFTVSVSGTAGTAQMNTLTIYENGIKVPLDRIADGASANPVLLLGDEKDRFTKDITIIAPTESGSNTFTFEVADDDGGTATSSVNVSVVATPPAFSLVGTPALIDNVEAGSLVSINMAATAGDGDLLTIAVYEDGVLITDLERLRFLMASQQFTDNPYTIPVEYATGFEGNLIIRAHDEGTKTYSIEVSDVNGQFTSDVVDIAVFSGTAISAELTGVLLNQAGPAGTGGLDLDSGVGIGSGDDSAEIRDQGINTDLPAAENWLQQISGVNGTEIRTPDYSTQPEGFGFENITTIEQIIAGFDTGLALPNGDGTISDKVEIGDEFIAVREGRYYFLKVTNIQITDNDNNDAYEFSIKY